MKRKNRTYARRCNRHAKSRASERYGIEIGKAGLAGIVESIRAGNCRRHPDYDKTATRRVLIVPYQGREITVVYSKTLKQVVTVLPKEETPAVGNEIERNDDPDEFDIDLEDLKKLIREDWERYEARQRAYQNETGKRYEWLK